MRDIFITLIIFGAIPFVLSRPHVGVVMWCWISYMNPHRLAWGFAYNYPFAQVVALATIVSLFISKDKKKFIWNPLTVVWVSFIVWMTITSFFALVPSEVWWEWERTMKIQLFTIITIMVMTTKNRIFALIWIIVLSLAFFGIKGGVFSVLTGGSFRVWGPTGSFIEDNNALALSLVMILPLMKFLHSQFKNKYFKMIMLAAMGFTALSILTSYSRGALVAIAAMLIYLWINSRHKLWTGLIIIAFIPIALNMMPDAWFDRMNTLKTYEEDGSANARFNAWHYAYNLALDNPVTGGGFQTFTRELFYKYAPDPTIFGDSHSIYFEVLAEHGFTGLFLFLLIAFLTMASAHKLKQKTKNNDEVTWVYELASMTQVSLIGFYVGGAFLGLAYFDLYWHLVSIVIILQIYMRDGVYLSDDRSNKEESRIE